MNKFQYAPGLPGYGTKGIDGSTGLLGLSLYFSEYNGSETTSPLTSKIANNQTLFNDSDYIPGYPARVYQNGDMFVDVNGKVFEITNADTGGFIYTKAQINTSNLFIPGVKSGNFNRYSNDYITQKYIVDDVLTRNPVSDYTNNPSNIYAISTFDYMKVKYSDGNVSGSDYIPFDVYTSGSGENDSIAIVKNSDTNIFRIGNLDDNETVRDTHIIFDASTVKVSKDKGAMFNHETESGTILTNYEIEANYLFNPNFTYNPTTFTYGSGTNDVSISWNLFDFINTTDINIIDAINADLYFYKKDESYNNRTITFNKDNSIYNPLVISNIDSSGILNIDGLETETEYESYLVFNHVGWHRSSNRKIFLTGSNDPAAFNIDVSADPIFSSILAIGGTYNIDVSITGYSTGSVNITDSQGWISQGTPVTLSTGLIQYPITIDSNAATARSGQIYVNSPDPTSPETVQVEQTGVAATTHTVTFDVAWIGDPNVNYGLGGTVELIDVSTSTAISGGTNTTITKYNNSNISTWDVSDGVYKISMNDITGWEYSNTVISQRQWATSNSGPWTNTTDYSDEFNVNDAVIRSGQLYGTE